MIRIVDISNIVENYIGYNNYMDNNYYKKIFGRKISINKVIIILSYIYYVF